MIRPTALLLAALVVAAPGCTGGSSASGAGSGDGPAPTDPPGTATVVRVVDGDTVVVRIAGRDETVRLIGIDTPETVKPDAPVECFGHEASDHTTALLPVGAEVRLVRDVEARDDYGRLLAYVYRAADDLFVNLDLVEAGYARPLTIPPNVAHADDMVDAARRAEEADRGLWSACTG